MGVGTKANPNYDPSSAYPSPVDYSEALRYGSDDHKTVELAQIQSQRFQMHQLNLDREMQFAANVQLAIEGLDTNLRVSKLEFVQQMTAEEDRHAERLAQAENKLRRLQSTHSTAAELPPPEIE
ncbi:MAG TPA: hypothetical protein VLJ37_02125 [bacterium]|nr:hypothetical protein [bacterium]